MTTHETEATAAEKARRQALQAVLDYIKQEHRPWPSVIGVQQQAAWGLSASVIGKKVAELLDAGCDNPPEAE